MTAHVSDDDPRIMPLDERPQQPISPVIDDSGSRSGSENSSQQYGGANIIDTSKSSNNVGSRQSDFTIIWRNLSYTVDTTRWYHRVKERLLGKVTNPYDVESEPTTNTGSSSGQARYGRRKILNQVCGFVKSRQLTAILGPSGAGKSSLLHCLFQNRTIGTTGQILVEGPNRNKLKVCFIPQHDYLNEYLTVREDLIFVSKLKLARVEGILRDDTTTTHGGESVTPSSSPPPPPPPAQPGSKTTYVRRVGDDSRTSLIDHEANALYVAELLGLVNCLDVTIKNISGGQKKRLSIARELMSKPDILILDEPTTGLDSLTCYKTVMVLKDLVRLSPNPIAVVVTIHQPQRAVFNLFDKTYFLSSKGRVIYDGDPRNLAQTMASVGNLKLPTANYNPASFLIEAASDESRSDTIDRLSQHQLIEFHNKYDTSSLRALVRSKAAINNQSWKICAVDDGSTTLSDNSAADAAAAAAAAATRSQRAPERQQPSAAAGVKTIEGSRTQSSAAGEEDEENSISDQYHISYQLKNCLSSHSNNLFQSFRNVFILTHRSWLSVIRNSSFTRSRLAFHTILPLLMLIVFGSSMGKPNICPKLDAKLSMSDLSNDIKTGHIGQNMHDTRLAMENVSFFFILIYGFGINIISCTASFYPLTMHMFKKEMINGLYTSGPYFIGQMLAELPLEIFFPSLSILISYHLSGQISSYFEWRMFAMAYVVFIVSYAIHSLGLLSGSIFVNNVSVAVLAGQVVLLPLILLAGFLMRPPQMPPWMRRLSYASPFKHGVSGLVAARYGFDVCECDEDLLADGQGSATIAISPQVKHVMDYLFPKSNDTGSGDEFSITEIFDTLGQRFAKASNNGLDIKSCDDVKPYLLYLFDVEDSDLFYSVAYLILIITLLKLVTYSIMKSFPYR